MPVSFIRLVRIDLWCNSRKAAEGHFVCACFAESILIWVTAGVRLLCVYANRKMANKFIGDGSSLFLFPLVTCAKESENQPNGFVESRRKSQPSSSQKVKAQTSASSLDNLVLSTELIMQIGHRKEIEWNYWNTDEGIFVKDALQKARSART